MAEIAIWWPPPVEWIFANTFVKINNKKKKRVTPQLYTQQLKNNCVKADLKLFFSYKIYCLEFFIIIF